MGYTEDPLPDALALVGEDNTSNVSSYINLLSLKGQNEGVHCNNIALVLKTFFISGGT